MSKSIFTPITAEQKAQINSVDTVHALATLVLLLLVESNYIGAARTVRLALDALPAESLNQELNQTARQCLAWTRTPATLIIALVEELKASQQMQAAAAISERLARLALDTTNPPSELVALIGQAYHCATRVGKTETAKYLSRKIELVDAA